MTTFALDLSRAIERAKDEAETVVRYTALQLFNRVIEKSPVLTGRFRNNWNCSLGEADYSTTEETDKSGAKAKAKVEAVISSYTLDGKSLFLSNGLPYAMRLEEGYSMQAPRGMVRLSIMEINAGAVNTQIAAMARKAGV